MRKLIFLGLLSIFFETYSQTEFLKNKFKFEIGYHDFLYNNHTGPNFAISYSRYLNERLYLSYTGSISASSKYGFHNYKYSGGIRFGEIDLMINYSLFEFSKLKIETGFGFLIDRYQWLYTEMGSDEKTVMENILSVKDYETDSEVGIGIIASLGITLDITQNTNITLREIFGMDDLDNQFYTTRLGLTYNF